MERSPRIVLIPAAGASQRFADAGFSKPKGLIPVDLGGYRQPLLSHILQQIPEWFLPMIVCRGEHEKEFQKIQTSCGFPAFTKALDAPTKGQSHTILAAIDGWDTDLYILNCDVWIDRQVFLKMNQTTVVLHRDLGSQPIYSYVDDPLHPRCFVEKKRISDWAQTGLWRLNARILSASIKNQIMTHNGEFYLSGALTEYGERIKGMCIDGRLFKDLGTPEAIRIAGGRIG